MSPRRNVVAKAGVLRGSGSFAGLVALPPPRSARAGTRLHSYTEHRVIQIGEGRLPGPPP